MIRILISFLAFLCAVSASAISIEERIRSYPQTSELELVQELKKLPDRAKPNYAKANDYVAQAWKAHERKDDEAAFRLFCLSVAEIPQNGWYFFSLGSFLVWHLHSYEAAVLASTIAIEKDPHPDYETVLALARQKLGKTEAARQTYLSAFSRYASLFSSESTWTEDERQERVKQRRSAYGLYVHFLYSNLELEEAIAFANAKLAEDPKIDDWYFNEGAGKAAYLLGHRAFGRRRFDEAVESYKTAIAYLKKNPDGWKQTAKYSDPELLLRFAQKRAAMKSVEAPTHFKILLVVVKNADVTVVDAAGQPKRVVTSVSDKQKQAMEDNFYMLSPLFEALSGGKWTLDIDETVYDGTVTQIVDSTYTELGATTKVKTANFHTIRPDIGALWKQNVDRYDAFALFWNSERILNEGTGGLIEYPLVPYSVFSNLRSMINVPHGFVPSPEVYIFFMHEVFHNVEALASITPIHGYREGLRSSFPQWKGTTELDYYAWTFENAIPKVEAKGLGGATLRGFEALSPLARYRDLSAAYYDAVKDKVTAIGESDRQTAWETAQRASEAYRKNNDPQAARALCQKALKLNPYLVQALVLLGQIEIEAKNPKAAMQALQKPADWGTGSWESQAYANLLRSEKKDYALADSYYRKALTLATNADEFGSASFQWAENARLDDQGKLAVERYRQAIEAAGKNDAWYSTYARFYKAQIQILTPETRERGLAEFRELVASSKALPWHFDNVQYELIWNQKEYPTARRFLDLRLESTQDRKQRGIVLSAYGRLEWEAQDYSEALRRYQAAVLEFPGDGPEKAEALFWNGFVLTQGLKDAKNGIPLMKRGYAMGYNQAWAKKTIDDWTAWLKSSNSR